MLLREDYMNNDPNKAANLERSFERHAKVLRGYRDDRGSSDATSSGDSKADSSSSHDER